MNVNGEALVNRAGDVSCPIRVWMVDDNANLREIIADVVGHLDPRFRFEREFSSPEGLLDALSQAPPDVLLLDIQMGSYNGLDWIRPAKMLAPQTRVLMLTTLGNREAQAQAAFEGASDFLLKSWSAQEIRERIHNVMRVESPMPQEKQVDKQAPCEEANQVAADKRSVASAFSRRLSNILSLLGFPIPRLAER